MPSEKELIRRQTQAYKNRESLQPRDVLRMLCTGSNELYAEFKLRSQKLVLDQGRSKRFKAGQYVDLTCDGVYIGVNGYGRFVDYIFSIVDYDNPVRIAGYDAHCLPRVYEAWED